MIELFYSMKFQLLKFVASIELDQWSIVEENVISLNLLKNFFSANLSFLRQQKMQTINVTKMKPPFKDNRPWKTVTVTCTFDF